MTVRRTDEHGNVRAFSNNKIELTAKVVCESCNTGWMSDLETDVKSALLPLVVGSPTVVSLDEQRLLAAWAQKTAMTLEHTFSSPPESIYYSAEERSNFRTAGAIADGTTILVGHTGVHRSLERA